MNKIANIIKKCKKVAYNGETYFFILLTIITSLFIFILDLFDTQFSFHDILVEAHGLIYDILVLGILLTAYNYVRDKRDRILRMRNEILDFQFWKEPEATYRISGTIRRLNNEGVTDINLFGTHLENAKLEGVNLNRANIPRTNIINSYLVGCDLSQAKLQSSLFVNADLTQANLSQANLTAADLTHATTTGVNFRKAILVNAFLSKLNVPIDIYSKPSDQFVRTSNQFLQSDYITNHIISNSKKINPLDFRYKRVDIRKLNFSNYQPSNVDFQEADLSNALFWDANLSFSNFRGANLYWADFHNADLTGADLRDVLNIETANFKGAIITEIKLQDGVSINCT